MVDEACLPRRCLTMDSLLLSRAEVGKAFTGPLSNNGYQCYSILYIYLLKILRGIQFWLVYFGIFCGTLELKLQRGEPHTDGVAKIRTGYLPNKSLVFPQSTSGSVVGLI
jgi:hypothetical protein